MMFHMHSICLWTVANYKVFQNEISRFKEDMISWQRCDGLYYTHILSCCKCSQSQILFLKPIHGYGKANTCVTKCWLCGQKRELSTWSWQCHAKLVLSAFTWCACTLGHLFYNPCGFSLLQHWKKVLGCPWQGSFVGYEKMWVFLIWVSMPDVFPQCFRGCEYCMPLPLTESLGWWMRSCREKDRRKFSHLSTLHGIDDNNYFDLIFINLASLRVIKIRGSAAVFERNLCLWWLFSLLGWLKMVV